jgi:hypothetical protein
MWGFVLEFARREWLKKISTEEDLRAKIRTRNIANRKVRYRWSGVYEISEPQLDSIKD